MVLIGSSVNVLYKSQMRGLCFTLTHLVDLFYKYGNLRFNEDSQRKKGTGP